MTAGSWTGIWGLGTVSGMWACPVGWDSLWNVWPEVSEGAIPVHPPQVSPVPHQKHGLEKKQSRGNDEGCWEGFFPLGRMDTLCWELRMRTRCLWPRASPALRCALCFKKQRMSSPRSCSFFIPMDEVPNVHFLVPTVCSWLQTPPWFLEQHPPPHSHLSFGGDTVATRLLSPQLHPLQPQNKRLAQDFRWSLPLGLARSGESAEAGTAPWLRFPSSLQASENIIKQLHPARICQEKTRQEK